MVLPFFGITDLRFRRWTLVVAGKRSCRCPRWSRSSSVMFGAMMPPWVPGIRFAAGCFGWPDCSEWSGRSRPRSLWPRFWFVSVYSTPSTSGHVGQVVIGFGANCFHGSGRFRPWCCTQCASFMLPSLGTVCQAGLGNDAGRLRWSGRFYGLVLCRTLSAHAPRDDPLLR